MNWPMQRDCDTFYGRPINRDGSISRAWESVNLVTIKPPFTVYYGTTPVRGIRIHRRCAESLSRVLDRIWAAAGRQQSVVDAWGASKFAGSWVVRNKRGGGTLSMHAYGCAIDLDPARNPHRSTRPNFAKMPAFRVVEAFEAEGWIWGGRWSGRSCDGMHFQAARTTAVTARQLRDAGSREVAAIDSAKANGVGLIGTGAAGWGLLSQTNDAAQQAIGVANTVANGKATLSTFEIHWQVVALIALACAALFFAWKWWRAQQAGLYARLDNAQTGVRGDQLLEDFPLEGDVSDGVEF